MRTKYLPEIKNYLPNTPFIFVGTKSDLSESISLQESQINVSLENFNVQLLLSKISEMIMK
ncbi:P-loop_containing nucleoside triphosphate hydrolase [Hexamita inflata]|uniref:P-loop containing nucleoside triphosphate hydrolase n=1 Tax=Hexamita inflata TaxID=28002 RepID=A0AA86RG62_9EUKA|nr:P-loop containing nucleoside triphosphate hydrolase [Hexamita inflata]